MVCEFCTICTILDQRLYINVNNGLLEPFLLSLLKLNWRSHKADEVLTGGSLVVD